MTHSDTLHDSAIGHVQGSAHYVEDLPRREGELAVAVVGAPCVCGKLIAVQKDAALDMAGVAAVLTHDDIPGQNHFGPIFSDEPFLVEDEIAYLEQPIAVVAADTLEVAEEAARRIELIVEEKSPTLTIAQAEEVGSYLGVERFIRRGDVPGGLGQADHVLEGVFESNGQEQFYLESQAALSLPGEGDTMTLISSTQNPTEIQTVTAEILGWRRNQVICEVQRMGGAFGGKETQAALPAAFVALVTHVTGRPARIVYTKDDDMLRTGKRHPYETRYTVGFDNDGTIRATRFEVRSNGGAFADLSTAVLERTMLHLDNAYYLPAVEISARSCRTNLPPNTAFRGFGGPQAMAVTEAIVEEVARRTGVDALDVRRRNLYSNDPESDRTVTPYGQRVTNYLLPQIFDQLEESSRYGELREQVDQHNTSQERSLQGLSIVPVKFGISFTNKTLNQGNALVNVYADGTVQVSTGATEMGQGVNTKMAIIVAQEFGLSDDRVRVMQTSTEKNNNTSPTAASASTDLNGSAAVDACTQIRTRLADFAASLFADPDAGRQASPEHIRFEDNRVWDERIGTTRVLEFAELTRRAHTERVDLGARGFYATPGVDFNRDTGKGTPFAYFTTGACVARVSVDRLFGTLTVDSLDVLMDIGKPIHYEIERGQVIGGLIQGIGWVTDEELVYDDTGRLLSISPTTYKIPAITDLPRHFAVDFLDNDLNSHNLRSTKAVGEPPLMLGLAVWCAAHNAVASLAGKEPKGPLPLRLPATSEELLGVMESLAERSETVAVESVGVTNAD